MRQPPLDVVNNSDLLDCQPASGRLLAPHNYNSSRLTDLALGLYLAARKVGVSVPRLRELLQDVNWTKSGAIPLVTVQAAIKRLNSQPGDTFERAAEMLGKSVSWNEAGQADGTIRVLWPAPQQVFNDPAAFKLATAQNHQIDYTCSGPVIGGLPGLRKFHYSAFEIDCMEHSIKNWRASE